jgi:hypothetical protein
VDYEIVTTDVPGQANAGLNERGFWTPDAIERQLAHAPKDKV